MSFTSTHKDALLKAAGEYNSNDDEREILLSMEAAIRAYLAARGAKIVPAEPSTKWTETYCDVIPPLVRDFLGKVQGVCLGVAMSGRDHPNPDAVLMDLFTETQAILFPATEGSADE